MTNFQRLKYILGQKQKKKILWLLVPMSVTALFNTISVALIVPFLAVVATPSVIHLNDKISVIYNYLHFSSELIFTVFVGCLAFAILVVTNAFSIFTTWLSARVVANAGAVLKQDLYNNYLRSSYEYHLNKSSATLINNVLVLTHSICIQYIFPGVMAVSSLISVIVIIALVFVINPVIAVSIFIVFGSAYVLLFQGIKRKIADNSQKIVDSHVRMQKHAMETFSGIKDIKLRRSEKVFESYFLPLVAQQAKSDAYNRAICLTPKYALETVAFGGVILMIVLMLAFGKGAASIISTTAVYVYAGYRLMPALQQIFFSLSSMRSCDADIKSIYNSIQEMDDFDKSEIIYNKNISFVRSLELKNIFYRYPGSSKSALHSVNIRINCNQTVGIIGPTGAGKTTLIDIILGLLKPSSGEMCLDGVSLSSDENLAAWQKKIGYVPQHIFLADTTIRENIAFGVRRTDISDTRIKEAARMAALSDFIEQEAPDGYNTMVGERGVKLSGGQLQRIGIARALYQNPSILVLDEATSSLDNDTEADVMRAIYGMKDKITIIVIAHRLSTVAACDKLYKLKSGEVVAEGASLRDLV